MGTYERYWTKIKMFVMENKVGAIIGAVAPLPIAFFALWQNMSWWDTLYFPGQFLAGTAGIALSVVWGVLLGAAIQYVLVQLKRRM